MNNELAQKVRNLPKSSGIYIFRNKTRKIIYVGKAVNLKNRVSSYFQKNVDSEKTIKLIKNIDDVEIVKTGTEVGALFLEAELVKRYMPKFNIDLKDDKNYLYLKIPKEDFPLPTFVRNPEDDDAKYVGPFTDAGAAKKVLQILRKVFPFRDKGDLRAKRACLYFHIGQCPGVCLNKISSKDYKKNIRKIVSYYEGKGERLEKEFKREMRKVAKKHNFEKAVNLRNKIQYLERIKKIHISDRITGEIDSAVRKLKDLLNLKELPKRIECYDISNVQGINAVGSMSVFKNGLPAKKEYRKFKIKYTKGINDPAMIGEVLKRRFAKTGWAAPDLVVVDGGKGQLSSARKILSGYGLDIPVIGLAKRQEDIHLNKDDVFRVITLKKDSEAIHLLQRIRDEAHRFAITYFHKLQQDLSKVSQLDIIPGVGPKTRKKLMKEFGSVRGLKNAKKEEIERVVGEKVTKSIKENL